MNEMEKSTKQRSSNVPCSSISRINGESPEIGCLEMVKEENSSVSMESSMMSIEKSYIHKMLQDTLEQLKEKEHASV